MAMDEKCFLKLDIRFSFSIVCVVFPKTETSQKQSTVVIINPMCYYTESMKLFQCILSSQMFCSGNKQVSKLKAHFTLMFSHQLLKDMRCYAPVRTECLKEQTH